MQENLSSPDTSRIILRIDPKQSSSVQHLPRYTLCNSVIVFPIKSKVQVSSHWREELATSFPSCQRNFECYEWQIWSCISSLFLKKRTETLSFCTCSFVSWLPQHIWCLHRSLRAQNGIVGDVLIVVVIVILVSIQIGIFSFIVIPRIEFEFRTEGRMLVAVFAIVDQTIAEEWGTGGLRQMLRSRTEIRLLEWKRIFAWGWSENKFTLHTNLNRVHPMALPSWCTFKRRPVSFFPREKRRSQRLQAYLCCGWKGQCILEEIDRKAVDQTGSFSFDWLPDGLSPSSFALSISGSKCRRRQCTVRRWAHLKLRGERVDEENEW